MSDKITLTADGIIQLADGSIVLAKRKSEPYQGQWGLPGGKMEDKERIEETAVREAREETGLDVRLEKVVGVYSKNGRDPRGRFVSVVYLASPVSGVLEAASDAEELMITDDWIGIDLAFDHDQILADYRASLEHHNADK